MANEFKVKKGLIVDGSGTVVDIQGTEGQLFSVTDSLTGDLFSVSDVSGVPIFNVNSSGLSTFDGDINVADAKKLYFGAYSNLEIYQDGTEGGNNYITSITGDLTIDSQGDDLILKAADDAILYVQGSDIAIQAVGDGKVGLRYDNVEKIATSSTGATFTSKLLQTAHSTAVSNASYNSEAAVVAQATQSPANAYPGFGFHKSGELGVFLYAASRTRLKQRGDGGQEYDILNSNDGICITTGAQTFTGDKTFDDDIIVKGKASIGDAYSDGPHTFKGMAVFSTSKDNEEDWVDSPISVRERDLIGSTSADIKYSPNINFHWASRVSRSIYMSAQGEWYFGEYDANGSPSIDGKVWVHSLDVSNDATIDGSVNAISGTSHSFLTGNTNNVSTADTTGFRLHQTSYTDGRYTHRFRKYDQGGGVPLYIDSSSGTANIFTSLMRIGAYTGEVHTAEVYGGLKSTYMNTTGYQIAGTYVIDSSRNLVNIASGVFSGTLDVNGTSASTFYALEVSRSGTGTTTPDIWGTNGTFVIGTSASAEVLMMSGDDATFADDLTVNGELTFNGGNVEGYVSYTINMSNTSTYSVNKYYPVTIGGIGNGPIVNLRLENQLNSNVPSWSTHSSGFSLVLDYLTNGNGWGTQYQSRMIRTWTERYANVTILGGISQMTNSSQEVLWLRGGGIYYLKANKAGLTVTPRSSTYTTNSQSVSPTADNTIVNDVYSSAASTMGISNIALNSKLQHSGNLNNYLQFGTDNATLSEHTYFNKHVTVGNQTVTSSTTNYENVLRIKGKNNYSNGTNWYGTYGQILLHSDTNMTSSARRFLITNALGNNAFAIVRSTDGNTDPVVNSTGGGYTPNSGTADFVINNSGNIGIGQTQPSYKLHVVGDSLFTAAAKFNNTIKTTGTTISVTQSDGDDLAKIYQDSADGFLELFTGQATPLSRVKLSSYGDSYINPAASGKLGINSSSPRYQLDLAKVDDAAQTDYLALGVNNGPGTGDGTALGTGIVWKAHYSGYSKRSAGIMQVAQGNYFRSGLAFYTNNATSTSSDWVQRMYLDMDGKLILDPGTGVAVGNTVLDVQGSEGQLFSVTNSLTGSLFSVADVSGAPILCVKDNGYVEIDDNIHLRGRIYHKHPEAEQLYEQGSYFGFASPNVTESDIIFFVGGMTRMKVHDSGVELMDELKTHEIIPDGDSVRDIGTNTVRYRNIYADTLYGDGSNLTGISTGTPSNMVTTNTTQNISGQKTFTTTSYFNGGSVNARFSFVAGSAGSQIENSSTSLQTFRCDSDRLRFWMGGTGGSQETLTIVESGRVGVKKYNPAYQLDVTGTIRATSDVIAFSDKRVKENIKTIDNALDKVTKLRGVTYNRKDTEDKSTKIGVIAQEIEKILPEVVETDKKGLKSVAYGNVVGVLIEAVKELTAEVEQLKKQIK